MTTEPSLQGLLKKGDNNWNSSIHQTLGKPKSRIPQTCLCITFVHQQNLTREMRSDSSDVRRRELGRTRSTSLTLVFAEHNESLPSEEFPGWRTRSFKRTTRRILGHRKLLLFSVSFMFVATILYRRALCWPRDENLIEFHIHSRGHGHWAGAIVTIEALSKLGYRFRLFSGRDPPVQPAAYYPEVIETILRGEVPPIVKSIQRPLLQYTHVVQATMEEAFFQRICVALIASIRNPFLSRPLLIITDGDAPGLVQGWWNQVPTLALVHGNIFVQPSPSWVREDPSYEQAWRVEARKNSFNNLWAKYKIGFNHVPLPEMLHIGAREAVQEIAQIRAKQVTSYKSSVATSQMTKHRRVVSSYFRDQNGGKLVKALLEEGIDVIIFGKLDVPSPTKRAEGRLIRIEDTAYFVPIMAIADGIIGSAGCNLAAECYYAQIPMLMLHSDSDTEHRLNAAMVRRTNTYKDGSRAMFSCPFAELTNGIDEELHDEVQLFLDRVKASKASEAFYERRKYEMLDFSEMNYANELLEGSRDQMSEVLRVIDEVKAQGLC